MAETNGKLICTELMVQCVIPNSNLLGSSSVQRFEIFAVIILHENLVFRYLQKFKDWRLYITQTLVFRYSSEIHMDLQHENNIKSIFIPVKHSTKILTKIAVLFYILWSLLQLRKFFQPFLVCKFFGNTIVRGQYFTIGK